MEPTDDPRPSKTRLKQQAHELQALGEALAALPDATLATLPMPEALLDAVREFKRIRSHEGRRRQLQLIGKLMRQAPALPLREAVAAAQLGGARQTLALHQTEGWRLALVNDDEALARWRASFPQSDIQRLRSLIRAARKDATLPPEQRHGKAWRDLFQFVKPHLAATDPGGPIDE